MSDVGETPSNNGEGGICTTPSLHRIINLHLNKVKDKRLKIKKEGKTKVVDEVEAKTEEEERDEQQTPLKRKTRGEEEALESKKKIKNKPRTLGTFCLLQPPIYQMTKHPKRLSRPFNRKQSRPQ